MMRFLVLVLLVCSVFELEARPRRLRKKNSAETVFVIPPAPENRESPEVAEVPEGVADSGRLSGSSPESQEAGAGNAEKGTDPGTVEISGASYQELPIAGKGSAGAEQLYSFLLSINRTADAEFARELARYYVTEAEAEGINHDIAFAQMCLETGFLRFGGLVRPEMNNFCGLGSIGPGENGESFPSVEIGVRAHIQHLKAYATDLPLKGDLVDPRFRFVRRGSVPVLDGLAGTWAADREYAGKIKAILVRLHAYSGENR